ncbi:MAG: FAD-binding protein [Clostridia bacterium]
MFDIIIIGAGPAGTTAARMLGEKYKVAILDQRTFKATATQGKEEKCCGGLLSLKAQQVLAQMAISIPKSVLVEPQVFTVRAYDLEAKLDQHYQRAYLNIDRTAFDRYLFEMVPQQVEKITDCRVVKIEETNQGVIVSYLHNGSLLYITGKALLGADGAHSLVRRELYGKEFFQQEYLAIQEWFEISEKIPYHTSYFSKEVTDFYGWGIPKGKEFILGVAIPVGRDINACWQSFLEQVEKTGVKLGKRTKRHGCYLQRPQVWSDIALGKGRIALIGEAAGLISPSSAEGISFALRSGRLAALGCELSSKDIFAKYRKSCLGLRADIFSKWLKSIPMYTGVFRRAIFKTGVTAVKIYR